MRTDDDVDGLFEDVGTRYVAAIKAGDALFYPSDLDLSLGEDDSEVQWQVRICQALSKKDQAGSGKDNNDKANAKDVQHDVFAPPYQSGLFVREFKDHVALLNKFCVAPRHFLLVTRDFAEQDLPPSPAQVSLSYRIVREYFRTRHSGKELFAFYNCGQLSGASQPHRHVQFVEYENRTTQQGLPVESLLARIERDGKEFQHVHALPLPYQHFVVLLSPPADGNDMDSYFAQCLMQLLDSMFRARMVWDDGPKTAGRPAFNILLTTTALHLIPRRKADLSLDNYDRRLSMNSMGFAGFLLVRSKEELEGIKAFKGGVRGIMAALGCPPVADVTVSEGAPTSIEP